MSSWGGQILQCKPAPRLPHAHLASWCVQVPNPWVPGLWDSSMLFQRLQLGVGVEGQEKFWCFSFDTRRAESQNVSMIGQEMEQWEIRARRLPPSPLLDPDMS